MKKLQLILFFIFAVFCFGACEKAEYGEEDEPEMTGGNDDGDNGGWITTGGESGDGGFTLGSVVDVETFRNNIIYTQVWVEGYIVGAATGANNKVRYEFGPVFTFDTAILLADTPDASDVNETISVCLTKESATVRGELNLVDNPANKGRRIAVFGFQKKYLKIPGIADVDAYKFMD